MTRSRAASSEPAAGLALFAALPQSNSLEKAKPTMNNLEIESGAFATSFEDAPVPLSQAQKSTTLSNKITSILSTSYVDAEIREAFKTLDERHVRNTPEARRRLRVDAQKEVLDCNGGIVRDFGRVADVCGPGIPAKHLD